MHHKPQCLHSLSLPLSSIYTSIEKCPSLTSFILVFSLPLYPETCRVSNSFMPSTTSLRAMRVISCQNMFLGDTFSGAVNDIGLLTDSAHRLKNDECQWMYTHVPTERSSLHVLSRDSCLSLYLTWRSDSWLCHLVHFVRILPSVLFRTQTWPVNGMFSSDVVARIWSPSSC